MWPTNKPIETQYADCRFRSRLEARWAVFFNSMRFAWHYEPEGYALPSGNYLPDFWLPLPFRPEDDWKRPGYWFEVKPFTPSNEELALVRDLVLATGHCAYLVGGDIGQSCPVWRWNRDGSLCAAGAVLDDTLLSLFCSLNTRSEAPWPCIAESFTAARSARFEHGERGQPASHH